MEGRRVEELSQMAKSGSDISSFGVSKKERERERERERDRARLNWSTDVSLKWRKGGEEPVFRDDQKSRF